MTEAAPATQAGTNWNPRSAYERWMAAQELPIYRGHAADLPTIDLAPWPERDCSGDRQHGENRPALATKKILEDQRCEFHRVPPATKLGSAPTNTPLSKRNVVSTKRSARESWVTMTMVFLKLRLSFLSTDCKRRFHLTPR